MSRPITIDIPHRLGVAEARKRIADGLGQLEHQMPGGFAKVEQRWEADRLHLSAKVMGQAISGRADVLADVVKMEIDLPPVLAAIADVVKGRLKKQGQLLLEKK